MPLVKYTQDQIEKKNKELEIFLKKYHSIQVHVEDLFLVYKIRSGDIQDSVLKANELIGFLGLDLKAVETGKNTFKIS